MEWVEYFRDSMIEEMYRVVGEWELLINGQRVGLKVLENRLGRYFHNTSHHFLAHGQTEACIPAVAPGPYTTMQEALMTARESILKFYAISNGEGKWVPNKDYQ